GGGIRLFGLHHTRFCSEESTCVPCVGLGARIHCLRGCRSPVCWEVQLLLVASARFPEPRAEPSSLFSRPWSPARERCRRHTRTRGVQGGAPQEPRQSGRPPSGGTGGGRL